MSLLDKIDTDRWYGKLILMAMVLIGVTVLFVIPIRWQSNLFDHTQSNILDVLLFIFLGATLIFGFLQWLHRKNETWNQYKVRISFGVIAITSIIAFAVLNTINYYLPLDSQYTQKAVVLRQIDSGVGRGRKLITDMQLDNRDTIRIIDNDIYKKVSSRDSVRVTFHNGLLGWLVIKDVERISINIKRKL